METNDKTYGTLAVHLPNEVIARIDARARKEQRSRSFILRQIITDELASAPEPKIVFARRGNKKAAA